MEEQLAHADDSSHYEISLTAGQAFMAFVLLLLSLASSFAFGLMIGKGQADERLVVRKETPVVTEGTILPPKSKSERGEIVELGVADDDFQESDPVADPAATASSAEPATDSAAVAVTETTAPAAATAGEPPATSSGSEPVVIREVAPPVAPTAVGGTPAGAPQYKVAPAPARAQGTTTFAQLLSTGDQKTAEALAAKLIDRGFGNAYVERGATDKGPVYRVRVRFASEAEARAAATKLKEFSNDVWITSR